MLTSTDIDYNLNEIHNNRLIVSERKYIKIKKEIESDEEKEQKKDEEHDKNNKIEKMLEKLISITSNLNDKFTELDITVNNKFDEIEKRLINIETNKLIKNGNSECIEDLKELIKESLDIDMKDVIKALKYRDYRSILTLFKLYYKNVNNETHKYPIRLFKVRKFEYYANKKWNSDLYGSHSMEVIISNFQDLFIKYNNINQIGYDEFIQNQDFIQKLDEEKVKKSIFKVISEEIRE